MNLIQQLDVTYMQWKNMRTFLGGLVNGYYVEYPEGYTLVLVDLPRKFVTTSHLKNPSDISDFETTLKAVSINQFSIDDCIAAAVMGS